MRFVEVSIHAPARGATYRRVCPLRRQEFQSTRPRGARQAWEVLSMTKCVSIHAPARGATCKQISHMTAPRFQSTRPRGARRKLSGDACEFCVSIHAPARGATPVPIEQTPDAPVSIHAPARGATSRLLTRRNLLTRFNPRARAGRDIPDTNKSVFDAFQSTRPRGARPGKTRSTQRQKVSIHAPARGATITVEDIHQMHLFQSTRPRGARLPVCDAGAAITRFNPRARAGRDD